VDRVDSDSVVSDGKLQTPTDAAKERMTPAANPIEKTPANAASTVADLLR